MWLMLLGSGILDQAVEVIKNYPLCDRCLGRLFASLGTGLTNVERGLSLKILIAMHIHSRIVAGEDAYMDLLKQLSINAGGPFLKLYRKLSNEEVPGRLTCYICGDRFNDVVEEYVEKVAKILRSYDVETFLIGFRDPVEMEEAQQEIVDRFRLEHWEKVKEELKREIGKAVMSRYGYRAKYEDPDVVVEIDPVRDEVRAVFPSEIYVARLRKYARDLHIDSKALYGNSIESVLSEKASGVFEAEYISIKPSARIYPGYRVIGSGLSVSVEIHSPKRRFRDVKSVEDALNIDPERYSLEIISRVRRRNIGELGGYIRRIVYRVLVHFDSECIRDKAVEYVAEKIYGLSSEVIAQRTPSRMLRWKYDYTRYGRVKVVDVLGVSRGLFEVVLVSDKNLYIEEVVSGDYGRTEPSVSSVVGCGATPVKIDVLGAEH